ncbi:MAG: S8 family serine peptidase, partial [Verrucomicrobiales bacterium]|nr:S8 family serine peptidase [Verrucomicrobiales bacterium]
MIAKVTDVAAWEALSEVKPGARLDGAGAQAEAIVTGRIPLSRVEAVRQQPFVVSLKAARVLRRTLAETVPGVEATVAKLPAGHKSAGGKGVVVGVVDFGCDFAHRNFLGSTGKTRLLGIWDQAGTAGTPGSFGYGRFISPVEINKALKQADPYVALGYGPEVDTASDRGSHGTHVLDIAAGNGRGSGVAGVAPSADLLFVEAASSDVPWQGPDTVGKSFGDSVQLLEAVQFIFDRAGTKPCVVNLSLGTNGGPHDGTTLVEQGLDRLVRAQPNRAVVIAASNSYADGIHASGQVAAGGVVELAWQNPPGECELEVWFAGVDRFAAELVAPNGQVLTNVGPGENRTLTSQGIPVVFLTNRLNDPNNHDNVINLFLAAGLPAGTWRMRLRGVTVTDGRFHAWIERNDRSQAAFLSAAPDNTHTLGSISCGRET